MDDFSKFNDTEHMLKWLSDKPFEAIRAEIESILQSQVSDSKLLSIRVRTDPHWLTGAKKCDKDPNQAVVTRVGLAFEFELKAQESNGTVHLLMGTFSIVGVNLDDPANIKQQVWFDLDASLDTHGKEGELLTRIYAL